MIVVANWGPCYHYTKLPDLRLPFKCISYHSRVCNGRTIETWYHRERGSLSGNLPSLSDFLNPMDLPMTEEGVDVSHQLELLVNILAQPHPSRVPLHVRDSLDIVLDHFKNSHNSQLMPGGALAPTSSPPPVDVPELKIERHVKLNRKTTLEILYTYSNPNSIVEYPATCKNGSIGHLFAMDPELWINPTCNFIYSLGEPRGRMGTVEKPETCTLLVDNNGKLVPCKISHSTCKLFSQLY